jgi:hypothetical protein
MLTSSVRKLKMILNGINQQSSIHNHTFTNRSKLPETICCPSGLKATDDVCPGSNATSFLHRPHLHQVVSTSRDKMLPIRAEGDRNYITRLVRPAMQPHSCQKPQTAPSPTASCDLLGTPPIQSLQAHLFFSHWQKTLSCRLSVFSPKSVSSVISAFLL